MGIGIRSENIIDIQSGGRFVDTILMASNGEGLDYAGPR